MSGARTDDAIATLLDPVTFDDFRSRWQDRRPLHVARADREHFATLASVEGIEQLLSVQPLFFPQLQLSRAAEPIPKADYSDESGRIVAPRLMQHHANGATIVLSHAQERLPALASLCRGLEAGFGVRCQANIYLSPPGRQGFAPHYDSHDVFILQAAGAKRFAFYAGGPTLPLVGDRFDPARCSPGDKSLDLLLEAGSTLYIPRGVMHDAVADERMPSLHITVGTFAPTVLDALQGALQIAASRDTRLRRALDPAADTDIDELRGMLGALLDEQSLRESLTALHDDTALAARADVTGSSARSRRAATLSDTSRIRCRDGALWSAERNGDALHLRTAGAVLDCRGRLADAVHRLIEAGELDIASLPAGDADERLALARRLIEENLAEPMPD